MHRLPEGKFWPVHYYIFFHIKNKSTNDSNAMFADGFYTHLSFNKNSRFQQSK